MKFKLILLTLLISIAATAQERRPDTYAPTSHAAITSSSSSSLADNFVENFDGLAIGDLNGQNGWFAQFANWLVGNSNPYGGTQNMISLSDGLGQTFAVSETITPGNTGIHAATAYLSFDNNEGVTWEFIPQSAANSLVITRLLFDGAGGVFALSNTNGGEYLDTGATAPSGYFQVAVVADDATGLFTIYFDGNAVFTAPAFATQIDNIAFLSQMEVAGPLFFADELAISDSFVTAEVPTLGEWGLFAMLASFSVLGAFYVRKTRAA